MKIKLGISSCLLGNSVRFDGGHAWDRYITDMLGQYVDYVPVCPEVECGLSVPREAMRLVGDANNPRLITVHNKKDYTDKMLRWARTRVAELEQENLCGFIFKSKSPSSGMERVKVYDENGVPAKKGVGMFARSFMEHFPLLPVEEEGRLHDPVLRHPQRHMGTLRAHYRHHALDDPFYLPGLCDLTAHVDFSAVAHTGKTAGLELAGYTSQASFLLNSGLTELLMQKPPTDVAAYLPQANAVQRLVSPAEMGDLFKVIGLTKGRWRRWQGLRAGIGSIRFEALLSVGSPALNQETQAKLRSG